MSIDKSGAIPDATKEFRAPRYSLETNREFVNFQGVEVTKIDDTKPWKPAVELTVTKADGKVVEGLAANTPFFTFRDAGGKTLTVSAEAAGHIDKLHIKGEDEGSKFDEPSLEALFQDAAKKMRAGIAEEPGTSAFDVEMGKHMGKEGIASMNELVSSNEISEADMATAETYREEVKQLNKDGTKEAKQAFIDKFKNSNGDCKIQFKLVRGDVLVPIVDAAKRDTTKLFMVFGPGDKGDKTLYTVAPGRNMPRHPNPGQHKNAEGVLNEQTFNESADAWFDTVMLTGK